MSQYAVNGSVLGAIVAQAQGMISVQVPCTVEESLILMEARARTSDQTLHYVAAAVVAGDIRFD